MNDSWATPALDDFCSEYFKSVQDSRQSQQKEVNSSSCSKVPRPNSIGETGKHFQHQSSSSRLVPEVNSSSCSKVPRPNSIGETGKHFQHHSSSSRVVPEENLTDSRPPAMHYFFHHDQMVQKLVRERLQHFVPIGAETSQGNEYDVEENLHYR
jgi:hypothetical protein